MTNETEFNQLVDDILLHIEEQLDEVGPDIDYETTGGVLNMSFENGTQVIINRQMPVRQIWVAAKSGGFHFDFNESDERWQCQTTGEELYTLLSRVCSEQSGESVVLS